MNIFERWMVLRDYAEGKPPIVQRFIEDLIAAELKEFSDLLERRDRYVDAQKGQDRSEHRISIPPARRRALR